MDCSLTLADATRCHDRHAKPPVRNNPMLSRITFPFLCLFLSDIYFAHAGPLQDAARAGDVEQIKQLLAQGADINESTGVATALYYAIQEDHAEAAVLAPPEHLHRLSLPQGR